eukprot:3065661-Pyramimonas_sp.AAC.1
MPTWSRMGRSLKRTLSPLGTSRSRPVPGAWTPPAAGSCGRANDALDSASASELHGRAPRRDCAMRRARGAPRRRRDDVLSKKPVGEI